VVDGHLAACAHCAPGFAFAARPLAALAESRPRPVDAELRGRVRTVLHDAA
jgi:hypothetical protein